MSNDLELFKLYNNSKVDVLKEAGIDDSIYDAILDSRRDVISEAIDVILEDFESRQKVNVAAEFLANNHTGVKSGSYGLRQLKVDMCKRLNIAPGDNPIFNNLCFVVDEIKKVWGNIQNIKTVSKDHVIEALRNANSQIDDWFE